MRMQLFALAEAVEKDGERADVHGVRAQPHQVRVQAHQLVEEHAQPLCLLRNLQPQQLFDRQRIRHVVGHRREVVDAIRQRHHLLIELRLARLLDAGMQIANIRRQRNHRLAIDLQHQPQHAMGRRMLRTHVDDHRVVVRGRGIVVTSSVSDDVFDAGIQLLRSRHFL